MMKIENKKLLEESFFSLNSSSNERQKILQESQLEFFLKKFNQHSIKVDYPKETFEKLYK
jgi:hypothetical protein